MQTRCALPWLVVASVVLACGVALGAEGQSAEKKQEPKQEPLTVKVYRVEDLFIKRDWTPNRVGFPDILDRMTGTHGTAMFAADAGGESGRLFGVSSPSEGAIIGTTELVDIIKRTANNTTNAKVAPWSDEGGPAAIECLAAHDAVMLIVTQTSEGHERVAELLDGLLAERDVSGPMVNISAQWVEVEEGKGAQHIGRDPKRSLPMEIAPADMEKAGARVVYRASTTCFDRQTVFVSSGKLKAYLGKVDPIVISEALNGLSPDIHYLLVGAMLEVRPQLSRSRDTVLLDFRSFINQNGMVEYRPMPDLAVGERRGNPMRVDLAYPEVDFHTLRGSIRIPLDKTILVGGCTSAKMKDGKVLYLVVEVSASKDPREAAAETPKK